jgi:hypothetical protein
MVIVSPGAALLGVTLEMDGGLTKVPNPRTSPDDWPPTTTRTAGGVCHTLSATPGLPTVAKSTHTRQVDGWSTWTVAHAMPPMTNSSTSATVRARLLPHTVTFCVSPGRRATGWMDARVGEANEKVTVGLTRPVEVTRWMGMLLPTPGGRMNLTRVED